MTESSIEPHSRNVEVTVSEVCYFSPKSIFEYFYSDVCHIKGNCFCSGFLCYKYSHWSEKHLSLAEESRSSVMSLLTLYSSRPACLDLRVICSPVFSGSWKFNVPYILNSD